MPTHPNSQYARQRIGAPSTTGAGSGRPKGYTKADGKEYLPDKAYAKVRSMRDKLRSTIDAGNTDLAGAMSMLKSIKADTDELIHTVFGVAFDDVEFVPFSIEVGGVWGPAARRFFDGCLATANDARDVDFS